MSFFYKKLEDLAQRNYFNSKYLEKMSASKIGILTAEEFNEYCESSIHLIRAELLQNKRLSETKNSKLNKQNFDLHKQNSELGTQDFYLKKYNSQLHELMEFIEDIKKFYNRGSHLDQNTILDNYIQKCKAGMKSMSDAASPLARSLSQALAAITLSCITVMLVHGTTLPLLIGTVAVGLSCLFCVYIADSVEIARSLETPLIKIGEFLSALTLQKLKQSEQWTNNLQTNAQVPTASVVPTVETLPKAYTQPSNTQFFASVEPTSTSLPRYSLTDHHSSGSFVDSYNAASAGSGVGFGPRPFDKEDSHQSKTYQGNNEVDNSVQKYFSLCP